GISLLDVVYYCRPGRIVPLHCTQEDECIVGTHVSGGEAAACRWRAAIDAITSRHCPGCGRLRDIVAPTWCGQPMLHARVLRCPTVAALRSLPAQEETGPVYRYRPHRIEEEPEA
ncbi:MAG: hypothetical protein ACE5F6_00490, partial [Anaerolineae bacterium]